MKKKFITLILVVSFIFLLNNSISLGNDIEKEKVNDTTQELEEGIYEIYTCSYGTKVVDVYGASDSNGANVQVYERGNSNNQKFKVIQNNDGTYTFIAMHSNKALDVEAAGMSNGTNVWQYKQNGSDAQKWYLKSCGNGYYNIISKLNGLYLDILGGKETDWQNIQVYAGNNSNAQKFKLTKILNTSGTKTIEDGVYKIYSKVADNRVLEVANSSISNGATLKTAISSNKANQKFKISYNNDGTYSITLLHSGKAMDVQAASGKNGTLVQQYQNNGSNAQKWIITKNDDNTYSIISKCNGLVLDIYAGSTSIGAKVQTYHLNGSNAQKFTFEVCEAEKGTQSAEDGTYRILSSVDTTKVFDIVGGSTENSAKLQIWENTKGLQQKFEIQYVGDGYYKIKAKHSNKVLTVESQNPKLNSQITQQEDKDFDTQKWILKKQSESVYSIISKCGNLYIDLENDSNTNGQILKLKTQTDLAQQQFILVNETPETNIAQINDGIYRIQLKSNKVLEISGGSYDNFANVQIWEMANVQQQKFYITRINNTNYYKIIAVHSAKALDVYAGLGTPGVNVDQYQENGTDSQYWLLKDCGDGYYNIISKANGLYLDVYANATNNNGTNVQLYYGNGSNAQKFKFTPINIIDNNTYEIETKLDSNIVVDISGASTLDGANAQIWTADNVNQQRFTLEALSTDTYKIIAKHSNKALTVDTTSNNVYQDTYTGKNNQQWQIKSAGNGYYNLISKENGLALNIYDGLANNGQNIQVDSLNNEDAQKFRFVTGFRKFYEEGTYGKSGLVLAGDSRGTDLKYYKYGKGSKVLFTTFSIHGFEDAFNHDGAELTYIAEEFKKYLDNNIDESIVNNWTIYIFPKLNPDGQTYGYTNNGPGRNTLYSAAPANKGIDMNRNWSIGYKSQNSERYYNGTEAFQAYEARYLRDFILKHQGSSKNILVDTHGWLNETIGDNELGVYYRNQFGLPSHINSYGSGYLINWARTLTNARSLLVELPEVTSHSQLINGKYAQKYINATMQMLREN